MSSASSRLGTMRNSRPKMRARNRSASTAKAPGSSRCTRSIRSTSGSSAQQRALLVFGRRLTTAGAIAALGSTRCPAWPASGLFAATLVRSSQHQLLLRGELLYRQAHAESGPLVGNAFHRDGAAEQIHITLDNGQAEPGVGAIGMPGRIGVIKPLEDVRARLRRDADAGVAHLDYPVAVRTVVRSNHRTPLPIVFTVLT